jgi:elongation factor G
MNTRTMPMYKQTTREYPLERLRNIGIAAHIDAGKTTLTERVLFYTNAIHQCGEVHDGNATTDFNPIEQRKGITIFAAAVPCTWTPPDEGELGLVKLSPGLPHRLNVIDTPGHVDFTAEVERSLRVLDGAVAVFCGVAGVQPQSETVWRQADRYHVPRLAFVNKMDRVGADFANVLVQLKQKLGANAWPVLWPLGSEDALRGQLDIVNERALLFGENAGDGYSVELVPPESRDLVNHWRTRLVVNIAELDEEVAALWLENRPVPADVLKRAIRRAVIANRFVPVVGGSAYKFIGVQPLLDAVVDYLPSPVELPPLEAHSLAGTEMITIEAEESAPLAALAFKLVSDPTAGRLVMLRVYSGTLRKGDRVLNPRTGREARIGRLVRVHADRREEILEASAGDIAAAVGLRGVATGDTLCAVGQPLLIEPPTFPEPVVSMAIEPARSAESERLGKHLQILSEDDPTFHVSTHEETGQTLISGMGELHLEVIRERLRTEFGLETTVGAPEIAYRETIQATAQADHLLKKQNGGVGMYARVILAVHPNARGAGLQVENRVSGGNIPAQFISAVRKGIDDALRSGVNGYPMVDVQVSILDGAAHVKDSNELAFRLAAAEATRDALRRAQPVLLEPIMKVELATPAEHQGDLLGDLNRRRGKVLAVEAKSQGTVVQAEVPLAGLFGYANAIRSLSRGRAAYSMSPSHFEVLPANLVVEVIGDKKTRK